MEYATPERARWHNDGRLQGEFGYLAWTQPFEAWNAGDGTELSGRPTRMRLSARVVIRGKPESRQ